MLGFFSHSTYKTTNAGFFSHSTYKTTWLVKNTPMKGLWE